LSGEAGDLQTKLLQQRQNRARLDDEIALSNAELRLLDDEIASLESAWKSYCDRAEQAERESANLKVRLEEADRGIRLRESERVGRQHDHTGAQVALAQMEERFIGLQERFEQLEADLRRGREEGERVGRHEAVLENRLTDCRLAVLRTSA